MNKLFGRRGAFLIEVLMSLAMLAFGITACLRAMAQGLEIAKRSEEYRLAVNALDELYFRMLGGPDDTLLKDGGDGAFKMEGFALTDMRYAVESRQIRPYEPPTEEELAEMERAGVKPPPPDPLEQVEEHYRIVKASVSWREGKQDLDFYTVVRVPHVDKTK